MSGSAQARGWRARLQLDYQDVEKRTVLAKRRHEGPLLVQRAFYPESAAPGMSEPCHSYIIHPPGGVCSGDDLQLEVDLRSGSHALLTTPAAGKFYRRGAAGAARMTQSFRVDGATLEWLPQENIYYPDAAVELSSTVRLAAGARFIGWEIGCLGLPARGAPLGAGSVRLQFALWRDGQPLLIERLALSADSLAARWGMAGLTSLGTALAYPAGLSELALARACVPDDCAELAVACTLLDGVLACRGIARRADHLREAFVRLWCVLRPAILTREAVVPRIWST